MAASFTVDRIGAEGVPVLISDGVLGDTTRLRSEGVRAHYEAIGPHYPGIRAHAPKAYANAVARAVARPFFELLDWGDQDRFEVVSCTYSLITTPPEALTPVQRLPHFDGIDESVIAVIHYLCGPEHGGTSFFRQRATGFEYVTKKRLPTYESALRAAVAEHGLPERRYREGSDAIFEETATIDCTHDRLVAYPGTTLHCGRIPTGHDRSNDPEQGRLTVNTFLKRAGRRE